MSWPGPGDPFYSYNPGENNARRSLYQVPYVPLIMIDGVAETYQFSTDSVRNAVSLRREIPSPCTMEVSAFAAGTTVHATARVTAEVALHGAVHHLFLALIHNEQQIGAVIYTHPFRDMEPDASGELFELDADSTFELVVEFPTESGWDLANMAVVAFIQDNSTREVLQAAYGEVNADYSMELAATLERTQMVEPSSDVEFTAILTNTGTEADSYVATLTGDLPAGWTRTIELDGGTPDPSSIVVDLDSSQDALLRVRVHPNGIPGTGYTNLNVVSTGQPEIIGEADFVLLSGLDILLVDDDQELDFEDYFEASLETLPFVSGTWETFYNNPATEDLNQVGCVIWQTGNRYGCFDDEEQANLAAFLDSGGSLFLSGQGIGFSLGFPHPGTPFFTDYLHADYVTVYRDGLTVSGVPGDPIADGMSFAISGGTGANNQTHQSDIDPLDGTAVTFVTYTPGTYQHNAGLRIETPSYRAILLGFGFEAIAEEATRHQFMANVLEWLQVESNSERDSNLQALSYALGQGYPNPFNPVVTIPYALEHRSAVRLSIFDILGREVVVLASGIRNSGAHTARWDASGFPSGLYFSRLTAQPNFTATRKLILLK